MFLGLLLIILSAFMLKKSISNKKKSKLKSTIKTDGEILNNSYILLHEKKMKDDAVYEEYLEWCKVKGELPVDKLGYDEHRMKEFHMYKKLVKSGLKGINEL